LNGDVVIHYEWRLVRPRDTTKKNFFYSYPTAKDAITGAQLGEVPRKGVDEFVSYARQSQKTRLLEYFETYTDCEYRHGYGEEEENIPEESDMIGARLCFACEHPFIKLPCCSYHRHDAFCDDLKCIIQRRWQDINKIIVREWAAFFGDRDPLQIEGGPLLADLPSVQNLDEYGSFRI